MITATYIKYFSPPEVGLRNHVEDLVVPLSRSLIPYSKDSSFPAVCFVVVHALARILDLVVEDGFYEKNDMHSWIRTRQGNVLDVLPVGVYPSLPILVMSRRVDPGSRLYTQDEAVNPWNIYGREKFENAVDECQELIIYQLKDFN